MRSKRGLQKKRISALEGRWAGMVTSSPAISNERTACAHYDDADAVGCSAGDRPIVWKIVHPYAELETRLKTEL